MRRLLTFAAFLLVLSLVPVSAQRGSGGRGGFGGRGVAMTHSSAGHALAGVRSGSGFRSFGGGFGGVRIRTRGFHQRTRFGSPWFAGYTYGGYYSPYWWDSSSTYSFDEDQEREVQLANQMNALSIQEQRLREREDWLREREAQDSNARRQVRREEQPAPSPATVLVFRDQHRQEVVNYAIAGGTLWVLSEQAAKKIPLADLDLAATTKANDERGVEFQVPK
jgi:hypothetical protein